MVLQARIRDNGVEETADELATGRPGRQGGQKGRKSRLDGSEMRIDSGRRRPDHADRGGGGGGRHKRVGVAKGAPALGTSLSRAAVFAAVHRVRQCTLIGVALLSKTALLMGCVECFVAQLITDPGGKQTWLPASHQAYLRHQHQQQNSNSKVRVFS